MSDEITLTLPRERPFYGVAHLVVGGLAARLDLTVETLEDLQTALDGLLGHDEGDAPVTVAVRVDEGFLAARVGPFQGEAIRRALAEDEGLGLRRILETVSDGVQVSEENGHQWVELTKRVEPRTPA